MATGTWDSRHVYRLEYTISSALSTKRTIIIYSCMSAIIMYPLYSYSKSKHVGMYSGCDTLSLQILFIFFGMAIPTSSFNFIWGFPIQIKLLKYVNF